MTSANGGGAPALRLAALESPTAGAASSKPSLWAAADVANFFRLPTADMARRFIGKLEKGGVTLRVPGQVSGRRFLVYAPRLLKAAGLSEEEIRAALGP